VIEAHGGRLINRILPRKEINSVKKRGIKKIRVSDEVVLDIEKISIGAYSPLEGFMCKKDLDSVIRRMRLSDGTPWTIPVFLTLRKDAAGKVSKGEELILQDKRGTDIALLKVRDIYSYPRKKWADAVYGTTSTRHPGVKRLYDIHGKVIGGDIWMIGRHSFEFEKFNLTPVQTRKIIKERKWKTVSGFQTRNAPHRAHEYLQKIALTITDGILIHPIIGWKKEGDFRPELVINAYRALIKNYFPENSVIFAGLATAMRYAGPREAVFHAIIRKNYGCTHFIVGRDHAGVGDFYGIYEAHRIFDHFPDIGVVPLLLRGPYYCVKCGDVVSDKICPHKERWHRHISGTMVRKSLFKGETLPEYVMRKEVFDVLKKSGTKNFI